MISGHAGIESGNLQTANVLPVVRPDFVKKLSQRLKAVEGELGVSKVKRHGFVTKVLGESPKYMHGHPFIKNPERAALKWKFIE